MQVTVMIPTKDRPGCLERVVELILGQTVLPSQIVIVDQSGSDESRRRVDALFAAALPTTRQTLLCYIHEPMIPGAAVAHFCFPQPDR